MLLFATKGALSPKQQHLPFRTDWNKDTGNIVFAGREIAPQYTADGKAYVNQADLDRVRQEAMNEIGLRDRRDIWQKYDDKYTPMMDDLLGRIYDREEFSYDPENDVVFNAYKDQYTREGDRAMRDAMGSMAGLTGGFNSSAAVTAGAQANQRWSDALMDRIPELAQQAYGRYVDDFNMNRQALSDINGISTDLFNREYGVNNDIINDIRYNNEMDIARDDKMYERNWNERAYQDQKAITDYNMEQQKISDAFLNANNRGFFTDEEAQILNLRPDENGDYPDPWSSEVRRAIAMNEQVNRPQSLWEYQNITDPTLRLQSQLSREEAQLMSDLAKGEKAYAAQIEQNGSSEGRWTGAYDGTKVDSNWAGKTQKLQSQYANQVRTNREGELDYIIVGGIPYTQDEIYEKVASGQFLIGEDEDGRTIITEK